jgi:hypothetical protein
MKKNKIYWVLLLGLLVTIAVYLFGKDIGELIGIL